MPERRRLFNGHVGELSLDFCPSGGRRVLRGIWGIDFHQFCLCSLGPGWGLLRHYWGSYEGQSRLWEVIEGLWRACESEVWTFLLLFFCPVSHFLAQQDPFQGPFTSGGKQMSVIVSEPCRFLCRYFGGVDQELIATTFGWKSCFFFTKFHSSGLQPVASDVFWHLPAVAESFWICDLDVQSQGCETELDTPKPSYAAASLPFL